MRRVAAFDFDGTLVRRDTLLPFLARVAGRRKLGAILAVEAPRTVRTRMALTAGAARELAAEPALHHRDDFKARVLRRVFAGRSAADIAELGAHYAAHVVGLLRPDTMSRLEWHRSEGHELVIVSASLLVYLEPFGRANGFDHTIAVELEVDAQGRFTGELAAPNVRGPEKAKRLGAWLGDEPVELWAYGDSSGDDELLAMANHPLRVSRASRRAGVADAAR